MDEKQNHRGNVRVKEQRQKDARSYGRTITRFLHAQIRQLLTSGLLIGAVALLLGIFMRFQAPLSSTPPSGVTVMSYSSFVEQVRASNVLAIIMQGHEIHGLLVK